MPCLKFIKQSANLLLYLLSWDGEVAHGVCLLQLSSHHLTHDLDFGPLAQLTTVLAHGSW